MKKRILCMAIALCMIAALLPTTVFAAEGDSFSISPSAGTTGYTVGSGSGKLGMNETVYYKAHSTYRGGLEQSNASDWIVRVKHSEEGFELTLKDAYITTNDSNNGSHVFEFYSSQPVKVVLEGNNVIENKNNYGGATLRFGGTGGAVITGSGTLTVSNESCGTNPSAITNYVSTIDCNGDLLIKDTTVSVTSVPLQGDSYSWHGIRCGGNLTIDNSNVTIDTRNSGIYMGSSRSTLTNNGSVTITGGSKVKISSRFFAVYQKGTFTINATEGTQVELNANLVSTSKPSSNMKANTYPALYKTPVITGSYVATASSDKALADTTPYELAENTVLTSADEAYRYFRLSYVAPAEPELSEPMVAPVLNNTLDMDVAIAKNAVDADGYAMFVPANGGEPVRANLVDDPKDDSIYVARLTGLAAKQMTDSYTVTIYDGRGVEASLPRTFSIAEYAIAQLRATDDAELKTLLVDMLVYGAMAQNQFGHSTDKLATDNLSGAELDLATQTMTPCVNNLKSAAGYLGTTFILESSIAMATAYDKAVVGEGAYAVVSFTNYAGTAITSQPIYASEYSNDNAVVFISNDMVAADGRCEITWTIYNAAGEEVVEITDSLASYTKRAMDAGDDFVAKVMIYADSAAAYLGK